MKKIVSIPVVLALLLLTGCEGERANKRTLFMLNTVVTITADCSDDVLDGAFSLIEDYEQLFSRTNEGSDVYRLNNEIGPVTVSDETAGLISRALYYSEKSGGAYDITIYPVSVLWDFERSLPPERSEISEALQNVDYESVEVAGNEVNLNGKKIDLGSIAKGYIADRLKEYFLKQGTEFSTISLGGNIVTFGKEQTIGIKKPFSEEIIASVELRDKSVVTAGVYERYIEYEDKIYHHIIDPKTGYGVQNSLHSVTVIGDNSADCDALSTVCILLGQTDGMRLIEQSEDIEAVFIDDKGKITLSSGLYRENDRILFK